MHTMHPSYPTLSLTGFDLPISILIIPYSRYRAGHDEISRNSHALVSIRWPGYESCKNFACTCELCSCYASTWVAVSQKHVVAFVLIVTPCTIANWVDWNTFVTCVTVWHPCHSVTLQRDTCHSVTFRPCDTTQVSHITSTFRLGICSWSQPLLCRVSQRVITRPYNPVIT